MSLVNIKIHQLPHAKGLSLPAYATEQSAGLDLTAAVNEDICLTPGSRALIQTGITMALPEGFEAQIRPRSGLAAKNGVTVLNTPGTIDADYRGEIKIILINLGQEDFVVSRGMRVAQMVIAPFSQASLAVQMNPLDSNTDRGEGGLGSTGLYAVNKE
ncbi:MAG: dUTP diphosphatase [Alphaproteobacteria bacterium]|nr:dUTP diphosphatase [Alphaproteobacteria bacterium]